MGRNRELKSALVCWGRCHPRVVGMAGRHRRWDWAVASAASSLRLAARCVKLLAWHLLEARLPLNAWVEPDAASCLLVLSEQVRATDVSGGSKRLQESSEGCSRYCSRP